MISIRKITKKDADYIAELRNRHIKYLRQQSWIGKDEQRLYQKNTSDIQMLITYCDIKYGIAGLTHIDHLAKKAEISILTENYIDNEVAIPVCRALIEHGFANLNLNKIYNEAYSLDTKKINLWDQLGFKREATLKDEYIYKNKYYNSFIYAIFNEEDK